MKALSTQELQRGEHTEVASLARARASQFAIWEAAAAGRPRPPTTPSTVSSVLMGHAGVAPGMIVVDMACGTGDPSVFIAARVGRTGHVVGIDFSPSMIAAAKENAAALNLRNTSFQVNADETQLPLASASADAFTCRFGLMAMPDPVAALQEWARVLKPGGRAAMSTHSSFPAFSLMMQAVEKFAPSIAEALCWQQSLSLRGADAIDNIFREAGFTAVKIEHVHQPYVRGSDVRDCCRKLLRGSPLYHHFQKLDLATCAQIENAFVSGLLAVQSDPRLIFADVLVASGVRV
jgi:ubiquinone/menaquinone biosynthesis C-methylase UbiE